MKRIRQIIFVGFVHPSSTRNIHRTASFVIHRLVRIVCLLLRHVANSRVGMTANVITLGIMRRVRIGFEEDVNRYSTSITSNFLLLFVFAISFSLRTSFTKFVSFRCGISDHATRIMLQEDAMRCFHFFRTQNQRALWRDSRLFMNRKQKASIRRRASSTYSNRYRCVILFSGTQGLFRNFMHINS